MPTEPDFATFQARVRDWLVECFGEEVLVARIERTHRFLEEAMELAQSAGCTEDDARRLLDYVFSRPAGDTRQEVGGTMTTLAAFCLGHDVDMREAGEAELARIWTKVEQIRAKRDSRPADSPLPQTVSTAWADEVRDRIGASVGGQDGVETARMVHDMAARLDRALAGIAERDAEIVRLRSEAAVAKAAVDAAVVFARYGSWSADANGWKVGSGGDRIRDWFGPSDFHRVRLAVEATGVVLEDDDADAYEVPPPSKGLDLMRRALEIIEQEQADLRGIAVVAASSRSTIRED